MFKLNRCFNVMVFTLLFGSIVLAPLASAHGDVEAVIVAISSEIENKPRDAVLYLMRARLHLEHEDVVAALADCDRAENVTADLSAVDLCRGEILHAVGRTAEALASLNRCLSSQPDNADALELRAHVLVKLNRQADALADLTQREQISILPQPQFYLDRLTIQQALKLPIEQLLAGLDQGMLRLGQIVVLEEAALHIELAAGRDEAAFLRLARLISGATRPEQWLLQRGDLLRRLGREYEATADYHSAQVAIEQLPAARRQAQATQNILASIHARFSIIDLTHKD